MGGGGDGCLMPELRGWAPQPGPQTLLVRCPVEDVLYGGARGGGKTDGLLGDWLLYQNRYGGESRGIIFRRTYPELEEVEQRAVSLFRRAGADWRGQARTFAFPNGSTLKLRYLKRDQDAENYQGHSYSWMGVDEAGSFPTPKPVDKLRATLRSAHGLPVRMRLTANPGGVGHNWLKARYVDPAPPKVPHEDETEVPGGGVARVQRVYIPSTIDDNRILLRADPRYWERVAAGATSEALLKAWRFGDWDIVAGGMVDDVWSRERHVLDPFEIPAGWKIDRAFDWGSSKPFSVGWWAESDGTEATLRDGSRWTWPRGTVFRIAEWYGWNGTPNEGQKLLAVEIARGIAEREKSVPWGGRVKDGPADPSIFAVQDGKSIADGMAMAGVRWLAADNSPGSRMAGAEEIRRRLKAGLAHPMEEPGLFVFSTCAHWLRTVPVIPRDDKKPDDVDTDAEDHPWDETRYRVRSVGRKGWTLRLR